MSASDDEDIAQHVGSISSSMTGQPSDRDDDDDDVEDDEAAAADEQADQVPELVADDVDSPAVALPPDGGWGWAVVAAAFFANLIVDGVAYTFGIIMPELIDHFESGKGKTALVGSLIPGVYLIVGPIVSALANRFGCRIVSIVGSLIAGVFFALSQLSPNIDVMIFTYGVMGGIGFGMMFLPSLVMVNFYFDKRRALANGIAVCGAGIGTFIMAPYVNFLVSEYGWKGTNLVIGGIIFHGVACGMIYRPLSSRLPDASMPVDKARRPHSAILRRILEDKRRWRTTSTGSLDGSMITKDNHIVYVDKSDSVASSLRVIHEHSAEELPFVQNEIVGQSAVGKNGHIPNGSSHKQADKTRVTDGLNVPPDSLYLADSKSLISRTLVTEVPAVTTSEEQKQIKQQLSNPFVRQDIFYTGSVTNLQEYKTSPDMAAYVQSYMSIPGAEAVGQSVLSVSRYSVACGILQQMFDFSLMRSLTFQIFSLSGILPSIGIYTPFIYVYEKAVQDIGLSRTRASMVLSVLGVCNMLGRLGAGLLADRPWADAIIIHNVAAILAGLLTCLVPVIYSFELLCLYAGLFGCFVAAFITLRPIIIVELLGIQQLTNAYGLSCLFLGIAYVVGSPINGAILEMTGSFVGPFLMSGCLIAAGGLLFLPARRIARWERERNDKCQHKTVKRKPGA